MEAYHAHFKNTFKQFKHFLNFAGINIYDEILFFNFITAKLNDMLDCEVNLEEHDTKGFFKKKFWRWVKVAIKVVKIIKRVRQGRYSGGSGGSGGSATGYI